MKMNLKLSQPLNCFSYQSMNTVTSKKVRFLEMKPKACNTMVRVKTESHRMEWSRKGLNTVVLILRCFDAE